MHLHRQTVKYSHAHIPINSSQFFFFFCPDEKSETGTKKRANSPLINRSQLLLTRRETLQLSIAWNYKRRMRFFFSRHVLQLLSVAASQTEKNKLWFWWSASEPARPVGTAQQPYCTQDGTRLSGGTLTASANGVKASIFLHQVFMVPVKKPPVPVSCRAHNNI